MQHRLALCNFVEMAEGIEPLYLYSLLEDITVSFSLGLIFLGKDSQ